jgi:hypothetical protein
MIILRENEIRKDKGVFKILNNPEKKSGFIRELSDVVSQQSQTIQSNWSCYQIS